MDVLCVLQLGPFARIRQAWESLVCSFFTLTVYCAFLLQQVLCLMFPRVKKVNTVTRKYIFPRTPARWILTLVLWGGGI